MLNQVLLFSGAVTTIIWGIAHLFPTRSVVDGFGNISADNKQIITMEWIIEGVSLIFIGILITGVTIIEAKNIISLFVYIISIIGLLAFAIISIFTGFKVNFLPFKLCPFIFTLSAMLILISLLI
jgi:hypothetical protein